MSSKQCCLLQWMGALTLFHWSKNTSKSPTWEDIVVSMKPSCWKRALLNRAKPVDGCQYLEPLDLTTPLLAYLVCNGHIIGVVKCVEEGARMVSYQDHTLVYNTFQKMQEHGIYLLDGHNMDSSAVLIVDNKVRFVDMALKQWFSPNIFIYDQTIHDEQQLKQAWLACWKQVELLFEHIDSEPSTSNRYWPCE
ncbi:hypothetical protein F5146DRAFT_1001709 [Armillaria mellea]|nr:hypothetical protein F5146DRAFT_1001709 [Armillaria mellea]